MPFKSKAQRAYLFAKHPGMARKWAQKYGYKIRKSKRRRRKK